MSKSKLLKRAAAASLLLLSLCRPSLAQDSYSNPVISGTYPDPSVCRVGEDYYLVNSSFHFFPAVPLWHSRDLVHWERLGNVLDRASQVPLEGAMRWGGIYATTIRHNDGVFYMVTTNTTSGGNFFVTTTDPRKGWSEPVWLEQGGIDPSFYFEDGHCYMVSNPDGTIMLCEIDPVTGKTVTASRPLWRGTGGRYPEGPHIYKKDGWYYLMISEGGTEYGHMVTISRSRSIEGPYESNPANPILTHRNQSGQSNPIQAVGHADMVQAADGSWWLVCLGIRPQAGQNHLLGRETFLAPVSWPQGEWPTVNGNGTLDLEMNVTPPAWHPCPETETCTDFRKASSFGPQWVFIRNPRMSSFSFDKSDGLSIKGSADGLDAIDHSPSFVGLRQSDIAFSAQTSVSLGVAANGDKAGLSVFLDAGKHYDIYVARGEGGKTLVQLRCCLDQLRTIVSSRELTSSKGVSLRIDAAAEQYDFSFSCDGKDFVKLGSLGTRYLSEEVQGGFTGCLTGIWCESDCDTEASFEYFDYKR